MGMDRTIAFTGAVPSWASIRERIVAAGLTVQLRMIDGLPAFPDEVPEDGWRELRVSTPGGMMTLRLQPGQLSVVVWGNAGAELLTDWEIVVRACSEAVNSNFKP